MPQINNAGLELIEKFEGCSLTAYYDPVGVLTIGFGHTGPDVFDGETISQTQADNLLQNDLERFEKGVNDLVARDLTPNQFAALVSFAYNLGIGALQSSTLLRMVNEGNFSGAAAQFGRWVFAGGQELEGLVARRQAEARLFQTP